jgi:L-fucose isomerase-like protein
MNTKVQLLNILVLYNPDRSWEAALGDARRPLEAVAHLQPLSLGAPEAIPSAARSAEAVYLLDPFAVQDQPETMNAITCPVIVNFQPLMWHSYDAIARSVFQRRGVPVLPSDSPVALANSLTALTARARLAKEKIILFVGQRGRNQNRESSQHLPERLGISVELREAEELKARAAAVSFNSARDVLTQWKRDIFNRIHPNISNDHLIEIARLYVAEKTIAEETGATALSVEEFAPFLFQNRPMPNVTYAILKNEGILTTEEADLGVLSTMVLLRALTGEPNTMANIYLAWRDEYERIGAENEYTPVMMRQDYQQCLSDGTVVVSHFGSAGSLPLNMMEENRYDVIETTPPWPGQAMLSSKPRLGPVILTRLHDDGNTLDVYPGEGLAVRLLERDDWQRLCWMVKIDTESFAANAIHAHWAIACPPPQQAFDILCRELLNMRTRIFQSDASVISTRRNFI